METAVQKGPEPLSVFPGVEAVGDQSPGLQSVQLSDTERVVAETCMFDLWRSTETSLFQQKLILYE